MNQSEAGFEVAKLINSTIYHVLKTPNVGIKFPKMDADSLYIACYGDASLSNNPDKVSSQIGGVPPSGTSAAMFKCFLGSAKKCPRVVSSILAGETIAAVTVFDLAFAIQHALEEATQRKLELFWFTDSYSLFQTIIRYQSVREERLLVDLSILRQGYRKKETANVVSSGPST
jgi:hypothetical protein